MPKIIYLPTYKNKNGKLSVIEKLTNFKIKRVFFIYDIKGVRGGHKHLKTKQLIISISGTCELLVKNKKKKLIKLFKLNNPNKGVLLYPDDWHTMKALKKNTILLVMASEFYNKNDYVNSID